MIHTLDGLPLGTSNRSAATALDEAIESYLAARADTPQRLKDALAEDPDNLMAGCFLGYLAKLAGDTVNSGRAAQLHHGLQLRLEHGPATDWERAHIAALGLWLADDLERLTAHFEALLADWPDDLLTLRMLHYLYFYDGDAMRMVSSLTPHLDRYAGHRLQGFVEGMYAFALEEAGELERAEHYGRSAVDRNPGDLWATHAVAHVLAAQGRSSEGVHWLESRRDHWRGANNFRFHLHWHEALNHLARHNPEMALAVYDEAVGPAVADDFYLDMCNAASLLLRLEVLGVDVGNRWHPLADVAERHVADTELAFASLHHLMPLLAADRAAAGRLLATLDHWAESETAQGRVVHAVGRQAGEFLRAVRQGEAARARDLFASFRARLHRIGGSHAQRELFDILALDTATRSGADDWAEALRRGSIAAA